MSGETTGCIAANNFMTVCIVGGEYLALEKIIPARIAQVLLLSGHPRRHA